MIITRDDEVRGHPPSTGVPRRGGARSRGLPVVYREYMGPNSVNNRSDVHTFESNRSDDDFESAVASFNRLALTSASATPRTQKLDSFLLQLDREDQKDILGEILYPIVQVILRPKESHPAYARKITKILMELSTVTLLDLQRNTTALEARVNETLENLRRRGFDPNGQEARQPPVFRD